MFIISYENIPLVIVHNTEFKLPSEILEWYAKTYAFELGKLTWSVVDEVTML